MFVLGRNDIFIVRSDLLRRFGIGATAVRRIHPGEEIRNYHLRGNEYVIFPYNATTLQLLRFPPKSAEQRYFSLFERTLSDRPTFSGTFADAGRTPYQFHQLPVERAKNPKSISFPEIATHGHFVFDPDGCAFNQKGPLIKLTPSSSPQEHYLLASVLNSSAALFWLKQVCFNKGAGEDEHRDRFEFAGGKVQQLPVPDRVAAAIRGKSNPLADGLTNLAGRCSELGRQLPALALRKLFEKSGEAYDAWNASLSRLVAPAAECLPPFASSASLRATLKTVIAARETRRAEMIGLQEEMDWLCYEAYGFASENPESNTKNLNLSELECPFRLWAEAGGDFGAAIALISEGWTADRKKLWQERLALIRDNEHIRRIEAPVYKRRWDEQWKVGNRWMSGPVAYAQEFIDAFTWWLAEKAEWHLEHKASGGPITPESWTVALWKDVRVAAAWPVVAESVNAVESWKASAKDKKPGQPIDADHSSFAKFFRETIDAETVPDGIPPGTPWEQLEKKGIKASAQAKKVRGKLNVPRERFRRKKDATYIWAGA